MDGALVLSLEYGLEMRIKPNTGNLIIFNEPELIPIL